MARSVSPFTRGSAGVPFFGGYITQHGEVVSEATDLLIAFFVVDQR